MRLCIRQSTRVHYNIYGVRCIAATQYSYKFYADFIQPFDYIIIEKVDCRCALCEFISEYIYTLHVNLDYSQCLLNRKLHL